MNAEALIIFIIVAFSFALIIIMKKDTLPGRLRRPLAAMSIIMVSCAFVLMLYSFFL